MRGELSDQIHGSTDSATAAGKTYEQSKTKAKRSRDLTENKIAPMCLAQKNYVETAYLAAVARRKIDDLNGALDFTPVP